MLFNSIEFLVFFLLFFAAFFLLKSGLLQLWLIAAASLYFYSAWNPWYVLLLVTTCAIAYLAQAQRIRMGLSIAALLGLLFFFKYYNFFASQLAALGVGLADLSALQIVLPVGISFYVFHAISLIVDRNRGVVPECRFMPLVSYVAFFPLLVAGPIVRAHVLIPQFQTKRIFNSYMFRSGMILFAAGMFKKLVIADNVGAFVDSVYESAGATTAANHIVAFYFYAIQIYYDFCGYSEMAIGIARTLGYRLPANFARPYLSASITEFWRRWHISLSSWLRLYLYIPLGGNRKGEIRTYINLALVMLLGGLWHGAAWTFVFWGGIHGLALAVERAMEYAPASPWGRRLGVFITFHLVCIAWVFFRAPDFAVAAAYFRGMTDWDSILTITTKFTVFRGFALVALFLLIEHFVQVRTFLRLRKPAMLLGVGAAYAAIFLLFGNFSAHPFIYFQF